MYMNHTTLTSAGNQQHKCIYTEFIYLKIFMLTRLSNLSMYLPFL